LSSVLPTILNTVVLLGGVAAQLPAQERFTFGLGAALASWLWFFAET
jgi:L-lysine exporter family protein LysE/ArgO